MKWRSISRPDPAPGQTITEPSIVQPNQSMSLQEILERFTRGEELAVGKDVQYHESDDDLEKVANMDLVDKQEFAEKLAETQRKYAAQEKRREKAERDKIVAEAAKKLADEQKAKEKTAPPSPPAE